MRFYVILIGALGFLALAFYAQNMRFAAKEAREHVASLQREISVREQQIAQAKQARAVAEAEASRRAAKAQELDQIKEALLRGEDDAEIPDWFRVFLDGLLRRDPR